MQFFKRLFEKKPEQIVHKIPLDSIMLIKQKYQTKQHFKNIDPNNPLSATDTMTISLFIEDNQFLHHAKGDTFTSDQMVQIVGKNIWKEVDGKKLQRTLLQEGVPYYLRRELWRQLAGIREQQKDCKFQYSELVGLTEIYKDKIQKDIHRTFSDHPFFKSTENTDRLRRILLAYSSYDLDVGYTQGLNFIAGAILRLLDFVTNEEELDFELLDDRAQEDSFWILVFLMNRLGLKRNFGEGIIGVHESIASLKKETEKKLPELAKHFTNIQLDWTVTFYHCYLTLTLNDTSPTMAARVMDLLLLEGLGVVTGMVLKGLEVCQLALLTLNADQIMQFVRRQLWTWVEEWVQAKSLNNQSKHIEVL